MNKRLTAGMFLFLAPVIPVMAAAGRASDGFLFFIAVLAFLGSILGILYLLDLGRSLIRKLLDRNGQELVP